MTEPQSVCVGCRFARWVNAPSEHLLDAHGICEWEPVAVSPAVAFTSKMIRSAGTAQSDWAITVYACAVREPLEMGVAT